MFDTLKIITFFFLPVSVLFSQTIVLHHTNGPMGGIVEGMDIALNGDIYAGGFSFLENYSGLYKSTDNGDTWQKIKNQFEDFEVYFFYISNDDNIWVGTNSQDRIYMSSDDGESWVVKSTGFNTGECWVIGEDNSGALFAGDANNGWIFRSANNGNSWEFAGNIYPLSIACDSNNIIYVGSFNGLYYSSDSGLNWEIHPDVTYPVSSLVIDSLNNIYCGTGYYDNSGDGVFCSSDGGQNFTQIGLNNKVVLSLAIDSDRSLFAGTLKDGLFKTTDNGNTWQMYSKGIYSKQVFRLKINSKNDLFIGSEGGGNGQQFYGGGGVFRSKNGGENFEHIGLPNSKVKNIIFSGDSLLLTSTPSGVQKYNKSTKKWSNIGLHNVEAISIQNTDLIYAATRDEGLFRSSDFGENWKLTNLTIDTLMPVFNVLSLNNDTVFVSTGFQMNLRMTLDSGNTWMIFPIKVGETSRILYEYNGKLFVSGFINGANTLFSKSALSNTFDTLFTGFTTSDLNNSLSIPNSNYMFLASNNNSLKGVFRSKDNGVNWENIFSEDIVPTIFSNAGGVVLTGSYYSAQLDNNKLYYSSDYGNNWSYFNLSTSNGIYFTDIKQDLNLKYYLGTSAAGIFEADIITDINEIPIIVNEFYLSQNFPNPFNPETKIKFSIPKSGIVKMVVYNILGQEIETLINSFHTTGKYEVNFNGKELSSGIYFYRLSIGEFDQTKKMLLLK